MWDLLGSVRFFSFQMPFALGHDPQVSCETSLLYDMYLCVPFFPSLKSSSLHVSSPLLLCFIVVSPAELRPLQWMQVLPWVLTSGIVDSADCVGNPAARQSQSKVADSLPKIDPKLLAQVVGVSSFNIFFAADWSGLPDKWLCPMSNFQGSWIIGPESLAYASSRLSCWPHVCVWAILKEMPWIAECKCACKKTNKHFNHNVDAPWDHFATKNKRRYLFVSMAGDATKHFDQVCYDHAAGIRHLWSSCWRGGLEQLRRSKQCFKGKREVERGEDEAQKASKRCLGSYL